MTAPTDLSATDILNQTLAAWGLGTLTTAATNLLTQGLDETTIEYELQSTPEYQTRFAGNAARSAAGLPVLTPAQYISTEETYRQIMTQYGLPSGFYDQPADFNNLIAGDVSPTELESRVKVAVNQYQNADQATKDTWQNYYGLSAGTAVAAILDPTHESLQDLTNQANNVSIGAAAANNGLAVSSTRANQFTQQGVTLAQAQQAYQNIAATLRPQNDIANRFGNTQTLDQTQTQQENSQLLNSGSDEAQLFNEDQSESALFAGHAGADSNSLKASQDY